MGGCFFYVYNIAYLRFDCKSLFCLPAYLVLLRYNTLKHITNIADSPAAKIKTPHKNTGIKTKADIGSDDINTFLDAISGHRFEVAFLPALYYGSRRKEIPGLKWSTIQKIRDKIRDRIFTR